MRVMAWPAFSNKNWNPYNSLLYGAIQKKGVEVIEFDGRVSADFRGIDILHIHWPDLFLKRRFRLQAALACARLLLIMKRARHAGTRVVWTAHNLQSHENLYPWLEKTFWSLFIRELDGVISMSAGGLAQARKLRLRTREIPCAVIPHGHYRGTYPDLTDRTAARERFGIPFTTLVFGQFGLIRPYKGLEKLVNSWTAWRERAEDSLLLIAGHPRTNDSTNSLHSMPPDPKGSNTTREASMRVISNTSSAHPTSLSSRIRKSSTPGPHCSPSRSTSRSCFRAPRPLPNCEIRWGRIGSTSTTGSLTPWS